MKILVVDDDELIRSAIKIKFEDVIEAKNGKEAVKVIDSTVDLVLMDIRMPVMDGIEATEIIKREYEQIKILMLTTFEDSEYIEKSLMAGADGYTLKTDINEIVAKVNSLNKSLISKILTERENEIAKLVAEGYDNKKIAKKLFLSDGTVRNNIVIIMEKLKAKNRTELAIKYLSF